VSVLALAGSGHKIAVFTFPFVVVCLVLDEAYPAWFHVGGPSTALRGASVVVLAAGVAVWAWSVTLLLTRARRGELITSGPCAVVKRPLYTPVSLLVLPSIGFVLGTWLGALTGIAMYVGSRIFAPEEEAELAKAFGRAWDDYSTTVRIRWL
jgi:protein-S-isoprenylcysteine O-methyltransferase Ste14